MFSILKLIVMALPVNEIVVFQNNVFLVLHLYNFYLFIIFIHTPSSPQVVVFLDGSDATQQSSSDIGTFFCKKRHIDISLLSKASCSCT